MQYRCSRCRCPLQTGQTMCGCGQLFNPVPVYDPNSLSNYYPWTSTSQPAIVCWWSNISSALKASVTGGAALVGIIIIGGGTVHHYQSLHARYAPGPPAMAASAAPTYMAPAAPAAPAMPAPVIMRAAPPEQTQEKSLYVPPVGRWNGNETTSVPPEQAASMGTNQSSASLGTSPSAYAAAKADAEKAVYDARDYVNSLTPADYQRAPINLQTYVSRVKQDRATMLGSPAVNPQDLAEVDADQKNIQSSEDSCNQNRGPASITIA